MLIIVHSKLLVHPRILLPRIVIILAPAIHKIISMSLVVRRISSDVIRRRSPGTRISVIHRVISSRIPLSWIVMFSRLVPVVVKIVLLLILLLRRPVLLRLTVLLKLLTVLLVGS